MPVNGELQQMHHLQNSQLMEIILLQEGFLTAVQEFLKGSLFPNLIVGRPPRTILRTTPRQNDG